MDANATDRYRVVEVIADLGSDQKPRHRYGSGLLIGGRSVLTSAHVVVGAAEVVVRRPDKSEMRADLATALIGEPDPRKVDLAILEIPEIEELPFIRIARVGRNTAIATFIEGCAAVGYPAFQEVTRDLGGRSIRETEHVRGYIAPLSGLVEGLLSLEVTASPRHELPPSGTTLAQSEWAGMSGAAVVAPDGQGGEVLLGVVAEHAPRRGQSSISVLPMDRLIDQRTAPMDAMTWWMRLGVNDPEHLAYVDVTGRVQRQNETGALEVAAFEPQTVYVAAGPFLMGSSGGQGIASYETPQYSIVLPAYRIGRSPVTNAQYFDFVRRTRSAVPAEMGWRLAAIGQLPRPETTDHPAVGMNWDEAVAYCRWLSDMTHRTYRLPSEAEWEKAARGTDGRKYPWGNDFALQRCNSLESGVGTTTAVGAYGIRGASVYGCDDMAGNVWEWTSTMWGTERGQPEFGPPFVVGDGRDRLEPATPFRELRICRGGSFQEPADRVTCTVRGRQPADARDNRRGFRVALTIEAGAARE
jgi:formylglycine-generating enzyme required for sulfatase activity